MQFSENLITRGDVVPEKVSNGCDTEKGRQVWKELTGSFAPSDSEYVSQGQDIVRQLLTGAGWRIIAAHDDTERIVRGTRSFVLSSSEQEGVKFVVTARGNKDDQPAKRPKTEDNTPHHFQATTIDHFYSQHSDRQGVAALGFEVDEGGVETIRKWKKERKKERRKEIKKKIILYY